MENYTLKDMRVAFDEGFALGQDMEPDTLDNDAEFNEFIERWDKSENEKKAYLFHFIYWTNAPAQYLLVYAKNEGEARKIACSNLAFNNGARPKPNEIVLSTVGI